MKPSRSSQQHVVLTVSFSRSSGVISRDTCRRTLAVLRPSKVFFGSSAMQTSRYVVRLTRSNATRLFVTMSNAYCPGRSSVALWRISATSCRYARWRKQVEDEAECGWYGVYDAGFCSDRGDDEMTFHDHSNAAEPRVTSNSTTLPPYCDDYKKGRDACATSRSSAPWRYRRTPEGTEVTCDSILSPTSKRGMIHSGTH